jgi:hypothetical protein
MEKRLARKKVGQEFPGLDRLLVKARVGRAPDPDNGRVAASACAGVLSIVGHGPPQIVRKTDMTAPCPPIVCTAEFSEEWCDEHTTVSATTNRGDLRPADHLDRGSGRGQADIIVIWGDDIGVDNVSAYNQGLMGYQTPNIDSIANEGALFTDAYAQQSCTAGRASFILGEHPFRTGLLTIGMPGSEHGIPDWSPTIAAAVGDDNIVDELKDGKTLNGKEWKVHLDGYNLLPFLSGKADASPRNEIFYFDQAGNLNAVRVRDWKVHFAINEGNITDAVREVTAWPKVINLRADPYEKAWDESGMYLRWYAENTLWTFVPMQQYIKQFFETFADYPYQTGSSLTASNLGYETLRQAELMKQLERAEFELGQRQ